MSRATRLVSGGEAAPGAAAPMIAADHDALLESDDPELARNKRLCYDMYRIVLQAGRADRAADFVTAGYIQHNPNVASGPGPLTEFIRNSRPERPILDHIELPLISIVAERDMVLFAFVRPEPEADGSLYHTSWFDLFRIEGHKIAEHWDPALKAPEMLRLDPNERRLSESGGSPPP